MAKEKKEKTAVVDEYFERLAEAAEEKKDQGSWLNDDYNGQLAIDVFQTADDIVIRAAIAGVQADDIDISVNNDVVTIRGRRQLDDEIPSSDYLYQECYWGGFSRTIILPVEVKADKVKASLKNGILRVSLPKAEKPKTPAITVVDED